MSRKNDLPELNVILIILVILLAIVVVRACWVTDSRMGAEPRATIAHLTPSEQAFVRSIKGELVAAKPGALVEMVDGNLFLFCGVRSNNGSDVAVNLQVAHDPSLGCRQTLFWDDLDLNRVKRIVGADESGYNELAGEFIQNIFDDVLGTK